MHLASTFGAIGHNLTPTINYGYYIESRRNTFWNNVDANKNLKDTNNAFEIGI